MAVRVEQFAKDRSLPASVRILRPGEDMSFAHHIGARRLWNMTVECKADGSGARVMADDKTADLTTNFSGSGASRMEEITGARRRSRSTLVELDADNTTFVAELKPNKILRRTTTLRVTYEQEVQGSRQEEQAKRVDLDAIGNTEMAAYH